MENIGLVSEPMALNSVDMATMPIITPAMMRHEAMRANTMNAPPIKSASVDTSPTEPGIWPIKASIQVSGWPVTAFCKPAAPPVDHCASAVAPEKPSTAVQIVSPVIAAG